MDTHDSSACPNLEPKGFETSPVVNGRVFQSNESVDLHSALEHNQQILREHGISVVCVQTPANGLGSDQMIPHDSSDIAKNMSNMLWRLDNLEQAYLQTRQALAQ